MINVKQWQPLHLILILQLYILNGSFHRVVSQDVCCPAAAGLLVSIWDRQHYRSRPSNTISVEKHFFFKKMVHIFFFIQCYQG